MVPPHDEVGRVEVERERRVAGEVLLRKGHIERDCRSSVSILARWITFLDVRVSAIRVPRFGQKLKED